MMSSVWTLRLKRRSAFFQRLAFLHTNLCQGEYTSKSSQMGSFQNYRITRGSGGFLPGGSVWRGSIPSGTKVPNSLVVTDLRPKAKALGYQPVPFKAEVN